MTIRKIVLTTAAFLTVFAGAVLVSLKVNETLGAVIVVLDLIVYLLYTAWQLDKGCSAVEDAGHEKVLDATRELTERLRQRAGGMQN